MRNSPFLIKSLAVSYVCLFAALGYCLLHFSQIVRVNSPGKPL